MRSTVGLLVGVILGLGGGACVWAETGRAFIASTQVEMKVPLGNATLIDTPSGLQVSVEVTGVSPGKHGLHIHQYGDCTDGGNAAGGHYNPDHVAHGFLPTDSLTKAHPGDLGNIEVGPDGSGHLTLVLPGVVLSGGKYSVGGRAIVLHEKDDDFGQPTGNAGSRIGCGTVLITKE